MKPLILKSIIKSKQYKADIKLTPMPKCYICFDKGELL